MKTEYTPGPWKLLPRDDEANPIIVIADPTQNWDIAEITIKYAPSPEQAKGNAHLIAAAPDMLDALKDLVSAFEPMWALYARSARNDTLDAARDAIAKAENR